MRGSVLAAPGSWLVVGAHGLSCFSSQMGLKLRPEGGLSPVRHQGSQARFVLILILIQNASSTWLKIRNY